MGAKVAIVEIDKQVQIAFSQALQLIKGIDDLNTPKRSVIIKVGVFNPAQGQHTTVPVTQAIIKSFNRAPQILLTESDNYRGTGLERLKIWQELFTNRVRPHNLSEDTENREVTIAGEDIQLSNILFKPNVLVSTHALRRYKEGTVIKNLLGLLPMRKKARFHKIMVPVLLDLYEAVGGIDLAVIDATTTYPGPAFSKGVLTNILIVGRDAVAVEAVGAALVGMKPEKMLVIQEAIKRELGEGNLDNIEIIGSQLAPLQKYVRQLLKDAKLKKRS